MKIVLASQNKHKIEEIRSVLSKFSIEVVSLSDIGLDDIAIVEYGNTFEENSMIKAREVLVRVNMPTIADDSGLEVDALDGRPGVYSARYAGENATDTENNAKLVAELEGIKLEDRTARYVSVITLLFENGDSIVARGHIDGNIAFEPSGGNGFGYDPYFVPRGFDKTFASFTIEEKNAISHRGKALVDLEKKLEEYLRGR